MILFEEITKQLSDGFEVEFRCDNTGLHIVELRKFHKDSTMISCLAKEFRPSESEYIAVLTLRGARAEMDEMFAEILGQEKT